MMPDGRVERGELQRVRRESAVRYSGRVSRGGCLGGFGGLKSPGVLGLELSGEVCPELGTWMVGANRRGAMMILVRDKKSKRVAMQGTSGGGGGGHDMEARDEIARRSEGGRD